MSRYGSNRCRFHAPAPAQVLIKVEACGVCHTDLHAANGDWPVKPTFPFIPRHEGVGRVVALGEGVDELAIGDAVGAPWLHDACGHCEYCLTGWETPCEKQRNTGYRVAVPATAMFTQHPAPSSRASLSPSSRDVAALPLR